MTFSCCWAVVPPASCAGQIAAAGGFVVAVKIGAQMAFKQWSLPPTAAIVGPGTGCLCQSVLVSRVWRRFLVLRCWRVQCLAVAWLQSAVSSGTALRSLLGPSMPQSGIALLRLWCRCRCCCNWLLLARVYCSLCICRVSVSHAPAQSLATASLPRVVRA